jgi:natural product biosynthesis luciferase-like monooxygenase protein
MRRSKRVWATTLRGGLKMSKLDELSQRLASLRPEQRRLLEQKLKSEGLERLTSTTGGPVVRTHEEQQPHSCRGMEFSIFFFSADGSSSNQGKYDLLLECARFADRRGFSAIWTPERHFQDFGGLYPNPSVLSAAVAMVTERIQIRAGSVVLPLHHPIRIAEEWSVVDNLSGGRIAISCATGWHPDDFVIAPEHYEHRREVMVRTLESVRKLWAGEALRFSGAGGTEVETRIYPRPVQRELPVWVTSSGNTQTWMLAGQLGANVLASMGSQPVEDLATKIRSYRESRAAAGHDPSSGIVTLMLHTFLGEDDAEVKRTVRGPMADYLYTHMRQRDSFVQLERITAEDKRALTELAFEHYFENASLLGTVERSSRMVDRLERIGVDEVACLVDFGVDAASILESLELLDSLRSQHLSVNAEVAKVQP